MPILIVIVDIYQTAFDNFLIKIHVLFKCNKTPNSKSRVKTKNKWLVLPSYCLFKMMFVLCKSIFILESSRTGVHSTVQVHCWSLFRIRWEHMKENKKIKHVCTSFVCHITMYNLIKFRNRSTTRMINNSSRAL